MKKNYYRVCLFEGANSASETAVLMASKSNGGDSYLALKDIAKIAEAEALKWPTLNPYTTVELIGDNLLQIDTKRGTEYKTVCIIEQVEIWEMTSSEMMEEKEAIL